MRLRTPALLAIGAVASLAGAVAVFATGRPGAVGSESIERGATAPFKVVARLTETMPAPRAFDRFAFVQPQDVALLVLPSVPVPAIAPLRDTLEPEVAAPWSTETRPEKAPSPPDESRISAWNPETVPRRLPQSHAPIRDYALARRLSQIGPGASKRVVERFGAAKIAWPPVEVGFVALKDEKSLDMYGRDEAGKWKLIHRYKVLAASGGAGPKLRQGDRQVPEGIYAISYLNPHSRYHVSLRVSYPNTFDRKMAALDGRRDLGGDIMIHGKASSIGCLAVGDEAAEEIFWLAAEIGQRNLRLIIAPTDFRRRGVPAIEAGKPQWLPKLYTEVAAAMAEYPTPPPQKVPPVSLLSFFGN